MVRTHSLNKILPRPVPPSSTTKEGKKISQDEVRAIFETHQNTEIKIGYERKL